MLSALILRRAVSRGEIRPLVEILDAVRSEVSGEIIGVEVESRQGRWLYELDQLSAKMQLCLASERLQCGVVRLTCCQQEIAPKARVVVPAQAQRFRALDCKRAYLLHRQSGDAISHGWPASRRTLPQLQ